MDGAGAGDAEDGAIVAGVAVDFSTAFHCFGGFNCGPDCGGNSFSGRALSCFVAVLGENGWSFGELRCLWGDSLAWDEFGFVDFLGGALDTAVPTYAKSSGADFCALPLQPDHFYSRNM